MTTPSQPTPKLVLQRAHSLAFHNPKTFLDFKIGQLHQPEPVFLNHFVRNYKIGAHCDKRFYRDAKPAIGENLGFEFGPFLLARGPGECLQCRQACKKYPSYSASESKVFVMPVNLPTILKNLYDRVAAVGVFDDGKIRIFCCASQRTLAMSTESTFHTWEFVAETVRHHLPHRSLRPAGDDSNWNDSRRKDL